jgi:hypothetical protein
MSRGSMSSFEPKLAGFEAGVVLRNLLDRLDGQAARNLDADTRR